MTDKPIAVDIGSHTISSVESLRASPEVGGMGSTFSELMSELERNHDSSFHSSKSPLKRGLDDLDAVVRQGLQDSQVQFMPGQTVISAIQESGRAQVAALRLQTTLNLAETAASGVKKAAEILNQK